jgi:acyl carrier protein
MENFEKIKEILVDVLGANKDDVKPESKFVDDLGADSLDLVELIMSLEDKFQIEISDADAETIITVQDALDYIAKNSK